MKKFFALALLILTATTAFAQGSDDDRPRRKKYKNELGLDATGFVKYFLYFGDNSGPNYSPAYYLTYRRYVGRGALRAAIGGNFSDGDGEASNTIITTPSGQTSQFTESRYSQLDARLGWEFYTGLGKRWQLYYGADARVSRGTGTAEYRRTSSTGEREEQESETEYSSYGAAPLLGVRFRITSRISLRTEASFGVYRSAQENEGYARYFSAGGVQISEQRMAQESDQTSTSFEQPLSLFITFDL